MVRLLLLSIFFISTLTLSGQSDRNGESNLLSLIDEKEIQIFPNPTSDIFYLKNDEEVARIMLYNIIGKEVKSYYHSIGNGYEVNDLRKGIYVVRLFDEKGKILKVLRLNKR